MSSRSHQSDLPSKAFDLKVWRDGTQMVVSDCISNLRFACSLSRSKGQFSRFIDPSPAQSDYSVKWLLRRQSAIPCNLHELFPSLITLCLSNCTDVRWLNCCSHFYIIADWHQNDFQTYSTLWTDRATGFGIDCIEVLSLDLIECIAA